MIRKNKKRGVAQSTGSNQGGSNQGLIPQEGYNIPPSNPQDYNPSSSYPQGSIPQGSIQQQYENPQENLIPGQMFRGNEEEILKARMARRHMTDGALSLEIDPSDFPDEQTGFYDNKDINFKPAKVSDKISGENTEYYLESIKHDKFIKIVKEGEKKEELLKEKQKKEEEERIAREKLRKKKESPKKKAEDLAKLREQKIFEDFDRKLTEMIYSISRFVQIFFLFIEGILAGISVLSIINFSNMDISGKDKEIFIELYSKNTIILYRLYYILIFISWVGNGIQCASAYQQFRILNDCFGIGDVKTLTSLKSKMIISAVFVILYFASLVLLQIIAGHAEAFALYDKLIYVDNDTDYLKQISELDYLVSPNYNLYKIMTIVINIICIILFIGYVIETAISPPQEFTIKTKVDTAVESLGEIKEESKKGDESTLNETILNTNTSLITET